MYLKFAENVGILVPIVNVYWVHKKREKTFKKMISAACVSLLCK